MKRQGTRNERGPNGELRGHRPSPAASRLPLPEGQGQGSISVPLPLGEGGRRPGEGLCPLNPPFSRLSIARSSSTSTIIFRTTHTAAPHPSGSAANGANSRRKNGG